MPMNRRKLIGLRNNITAYLDKLEKEDKVTNLDTIVAEIIDEKFYGLKDDIGAQLQDALQDSQAANLDTAEVVGAIKHLGKQVGNIIVQVPDDGSEKVVEAISNIRFPEINYPSSISVDNFPPQRIPQPVTNININSLRGPLKSTQIDVAGTAIALPTEPLANRRSVIVWNNSNSDTLWIGDANVTIGIGIPVKKQNYSPALDIGDKVTLYGITDGTTIDARILETSMDDIGA